MPTNGKLPLNICQAACNNTNMAFNIAYILNSTLPNAGSTKAFLSLLEGVMRLEVRPTVIVPDDNGVCRTLREMGVDLHVVRFKHHTYPDLNSAKDAILFLPRIAGRMWMNRRASAAVKKILLERRIQLVHTNVSVVSVGMTAAQSLGIPHVFHFREYGDLDFGMRYFPSKDIFYRRIAQSGSRFICITRGVMAHHNLPVDRTRVIYDGVKKHRDTMPDEDRGNYFMYAGRIEPTKGLIELLKAYREALSASEHLPALKILGAPSDANYSQEVMSYVLNHHLDGHLEFLGEKDNIDHYMAHALAIIIPSRFEGFGFCMTEAMFNGCIVCGYNNAGTKEQFDNGLQLTGAPIGFPYNTQEELKELLLRLSTTAKAELDPYRQRAFRAVNELYTAETHANTVYTFYRDILGNLNV